MLERLTRWVLRHRISVIATWAVIGVAGIGASFALPGKLTALTAVPGSQSSQVDAILSSHFNERDDGSFTIIRPLKQAEPAEIVEMQRSLKRAVSEIPSARILEQRALGGTLFAFIGTDLSLLDAADQVEHLRASLIRQGLLDAMVTGPPALEHDVRPLLAQDLRVGTAIALLLALILLVAALGRTRAVLVPFAVAGATVAAALCLILVVAQRFAMVLYIPNIIELVGLGLAIDFSLLIVHRYRSESAHAKSTDARSIHEALVRTMITAGRTVVLSGVTAAVGLSVLFLLPVPFVRSLGVAGMLVPLMAVLVALTLQPAMLSMMGPQGAASRGGILAAQPRTWESIADLVQRRPRRMMASGLVLLVLLASPVAWMQLAPASLTAIRSDAESLRAVAYLAARAGPGIVTPHQLLVDLGADGQAAGQDAQRLRLATHLSRFPEAFAAVTDTTTMFTDPAGHYQRFLVVGRHSFADEKTQRFLTAIRGLDLTRFGYSTKARMLVGGAPAQGVDFLDRVLRSMPLLVAISLLLAYILLARAFRSSLMPLVAVVLNLASVAAAIGVVAFIFRFAAPLIGAQPTHQLESWSLVFLFAMLFGLSMDYQVFLVSRIREARLSGAPLPSAIAQGLGSTGTVITVAAVIFVGALTGLVVGHIAGLQQLGVGLAAGVLIDATIVRGLVLPSALMLMSHRVDFGGPRQRS